MDYELLKRTRAELEINSKLRKVTVTCRCLATNSEMPESLNQGTEIAIPAKRTKKQPTCTKFLFQRLPEYGANRIKNLLC